jgi:hypothetical protein
MKKEQFGIPVGRFSVGGQVRVAARAPLILPRLKASPDILLRFTPSSIRHPSLAGLVWGMSVTLGQINR